MATSLDAPGARSPIGVLLVRPLALSVTSLLLGVALFVAARRLAGAVVEPPAPWLLIGVAIFLAGVSTLVRLAYGWLQGGSYWAWPAWLLPPITLLLLGAALSSTGASPWALAAYWLIVLGEQALWIGLLVRRGSLASVGILRTGRETSEAAPTADSPSTALAAAAGSSPTNVVHGSAFTEEPFGDDLPARTSQQMRRYRDSAGEVVEGLLRGEFAVGDRAASLHVAFCPPLDGDPEVECEQLDGFPIQIKLGEVRSYGMRLDLRLARRSDTPQQVVVGFLARYDDAGGEDSEREDSNGGS